MTQHVTASNLAQECNCRQKGPSRGRDRIVCALHWPIRVVVVEKFAMKHAGTHRLRPCAACMVRDLSERCLNRARGGGRRTSAALRRCMSVGGIAARFDAIGARNVVGRGQPNVQTEHYLHGCGACDTSGPVSGGDSVTDRSGAPAGDSLADRSVASRSVRRAMGQCFSQPRRVRIHEIGF
jgi:hypothetical protein